MSITLRYPFFVFLVASFLPALLVGPRAIEGQQPAPGPPLQEQDALQVAEPALTDEHLDLFVGIYLARAAIQDHFDQLLAAPRNKSDEAQRLLREQRRKEIERLHDEHGMSEEDYATIEFILSSDEAARERFEVARERLEAARAGDDRP